MLYSELKNKKIEFIFAKCIGISAQRKMYENKNIQHINKNSFS